MQSASTQSLYLCRKESPCASFRRALSRFPVTDVTSPLSTMSRRFFGEPHIYERAAKSPQENRWMDSGGTNLSPASRLSSTPCRAPHSVLFLRIDSSTAH